MTYHRNPLPTREEVTAEKLARECGARGHDFPQREGLRPDRSETGPDGMVVNERRTPCRVCGTVQVETWRMPATGPQPATVMAIGTYEPPQPGDVPNLADHVARLTDEEFAAALARRGYHHVPPAAAEGVTRPETLDIDVHVSARQFYLLDGNASVADIIPIPADHRSTVRPGRE